MTFFSGVSRFLLLWLALAAAPVPAVTTEEAERLLKQDIDRREQELRERRWEELHAPAAPAPGAPVAPAPEAPAPETPAPEASGGPCFPIHDIQIQPDDILSARRVQAIIAPYRGRCLRAADLNALQQALSAQALAEGLVTTRVVVPEQNLVAGILHFEVWPGRIEVLRAPSLGYGELVMASPLRLGDLLNLRALEQTVDNLNRLASQQVSIELLPGENPGGSIVAFNVARTAPWQAALSWQGEALNADKRTHALRASATLDNPLQLSDRLILGVNANLEDQQVDNAYGGSVDYDLPFGWWRFSIGADRFDYDNPLVRGVSTVNATGESRAWRGELARLLYRDARHRLSVALHGKQRLSNNFIDDIADGAAAEAIDVLTTRVSAWGLRADFSRVAAPWVCDVTVAVDKGTGRSWAAPSSIDRHYSRLSTSTRLQYHLAQASFSVSANGQWSDAQLTPGEQFTLTGQWSGFAPQVVSASTGMAMQVEAAFPRQVHGAGFTLLRPTVGFAWAMAPHHAGGNVGEAAYVTALNTGITAPWRQALMQARVALPLEKFSSIDATEDWQISAGFSVQW